MGESLKKLRKNGKEKRAMMRYLPGEGQHLNEAKTNILREWKTDHVKLLELTERRVARMTAAWDAGYSAKNTGEYAKCSVALATGPVPSRKAYWTGTSEGWPSGPTTVLKMRKLVGLAGIVNVEPNAMSNSVA